MYNILKHVFPFDERSRESFSIFLLEIKRNTLKNSSGDIEIDFVFCKKQRAEIYSHRQKVSESRARKKKTI